MLVLGIKICSTYIKLKTVLAYVDEHDIQKLNVSMFKCFFESSSTEN